MNEIIRKLILSWSNTEGNIHSLMEICEWIEDIKRTTHVKIEECSINDSSFWFYDDYNGEILNRKRSFFSVKGMRMFCDEKFMKEQPMIIQPEIGYLGIICKEIDGTINFLMQAKIEPGNINAVQISPTIQATKSNFTRAHGGKLPPYFQYFENASRYRIICDTIQPEQSARFYRKKNRNIVILIDDEIEVHKNYCWMTLGQLKYFLKQNNVVNMDTRTVLSCIPFGNAFVGASTAAQIADRFSDKALFCSIFASSGENVTDIRYFLNNYQMYHEIKTMPIPLNQLVDWKVDEYGVSSRKQSDFVVKYYNIQIDGREVHEWDQPLFKATNSAIFGLFTAVINEKRYFLVSVRSDIGTENMLEIAPTVQLDGSMADLPLGGGINALFLSKMKEGKFLVDVMLSEEGGRFYHEENRNVIIEIEQEEIGELPEGFFWLDYASIMKLLQLTTLVNIQLRNLLALLEI